MIDISPYVAMTREAGALLRRFHEQGFTVRNKGPRDLVTDADLAVERFFAERLGAMHPDIPLLGEESAKAGDRPSTCFILDPLDGTTNFAHGYAVFCTSFAFMRENALVWGIVYDPLRDELYTGITGEGSWLDGDRLSVSRTERLADALLATGFPYLDGTVMERSLNTFAHLLPRCHGIRRPGAAALDIAHLAAGRIDGFYELNLKAWDVAAGLVILREAGGRATRYDGTDSVPFDEEIAATNGLLHDALLERIRTSETRLPAFQRYFEETR